MPSALHEQRMAAVLAVLRRSGARSLLDLGCGDGPLLLRLARDERWNRLAGVDLSREALQDLERALERLGADCRDRVSLFHGSYTDHDPRLRGLDAAAMIETIEHVDPGRLSIVERAVFGYYRPGLVVMTTPNGEANAALGVPPHRRRHPDHRFEWTRAQFARWTAGVAARNGYRVEARDIGWPRAAGGGPTQMAVFTRDAR